MASNNSAIELTIIQNGADSNMVEACCLTLADLHVAATAPLPLQSRCTDLGSLVPGIANKLRKEAEKLFPNPPGSEFPSKLRISFKEGFGYRATAYAATGEEADSLLKDFLTHAKVYVANYDTYVFVGNALAENIDNFFSQSNTRRLGPYTLTLIERPDGVFIQMTRTAVSLYDFYATQAEFLDIGNFLHLLNDQTSPIHVQNVLRQISPEIDTAIKASRPHRYGVKLQSSSPRPVTLSDFFQNLEVSNGKSQSANKKVQLAFS
jgi:hypothetical protein